MSKKIIAICIQIRDGNSRLPGKGSMLLQGEPVYKHLMRNIGRCQRFINKHSEKKGLLAKVFFLVPFDEYDYWEVVADKELKQYDITVLPGEVDDNNDVMARFETMFKFHKPDYIVRLTGDCPFLPSALINKAVNCAVVHNLDYVSNVDERFRTMPDGFDVEVMSDEAFLWLSNNIDEGYETDREHVTTYLRRKAPDWLRQAIISGSFDLSASKWSLDTKADFEEMTKLYGRKVIKDTEAKKAGFGIYEY